MELHHIRQLFWNQTSLLDSLFQQFKYHLKTNAYDGVLALDFVMQQLKTLEDNINHTKKCADVSIQNYFDWLPNEVVQMIILFLPSFTEINRTASASKRFYNIIQSEDIIWKGP